MERRSGEQVVDPNQIQLWPEEKPQLDPETIRTLTKLATGNPHFQLSAQERADLTMRLRTRREAEIQVYEDQRAQGIYINELVFD